MVTAFTSVPLDPALRDALLDRLAETHARQPLGPDRPRDVIARVGPAVSALGLQAVRIRGTVSWRGVEVDHVWLAVAAARPAGPDGAADARAPWVLDAAFPLHAPEFAGALAGWVAGTTSMAELVGLARSAPMEDRVIGAVPDAAVYRGQPYWGRGWN